MDKLRKTSNIPPTTLSASISDTDTTIPLSSTVGAETSTCIDIVIDRIDAAGEKTPDKMEVVTVLISGNNGTNAVRGRTAPAMPHEQGAVVEYNISTSVLHNDLIDGISSILTPEGKPKEKSIPLNSINGGTKKGVPIVEEDGKTTIGKITSDNIDLATAQSLGYSIAAANLDSTNYYNAGSNRSRLKKQIIQRGNITIDGERNEFVIGENVKTVEIIGTVMAEGLQTYLYLIVQHKKKDQEDTKYKQVVHALGTPHTGYAGVTVHGVLHVTSGDRISVLHDCTGTVRGQYSNITVKSIA
jgi:hypothetical protein